MKHTLTLVRKSDSDAIYRAANVDAGKVTLSKISWFMPHVLLSDAEKFSLYKSIESTVSLPIAYRTRKCDTITVPEATLFAWRLGLENAPEKPRWIVVGFQTEKTGDETKNPAIFDYANLKNIYVTLNSTRYPAVEYNLSFANQQFSSVYGDASMFGVKFFGMEELITRSNISPVDYCDARPCRPKNQTNYDIKYFINI